MGAFMEGFLISMHRPIDRFAIDSMPVQWIEHPS